MEKLKEYLKENLTTEDLKEIVKSVNSWDNGLDYLDYWENGVDFFDTFFQGKPIEVARATCYGHYNYMDDFVRFDGYGNLVSCNEYEYESDLQDNIDDIINVYLDVYEYDFFKYDNAYKMIKEFLEENNEESEEE